MLVTLKDFTCITEVSVPDQSCILMRCRKVSQGSEFTQRVSWQDLQGIREMIILSLGEQTGEGVYLSDDIFMYWSCQVMLAEGA